MKNLPSILEIRSIDDRRGGCLGVFHRVVCLREVFLQNAQSNSYFRQVEAILWSRFKTGGDLTDLTSMEDAIEAHLPQEDDPIEFPLDLYAILCLCDVVTSIATSTCQVTSDLFFNFSEVVQGTFQVLIYPGIITDEIEKRVSQHPQVKHEEDFLGLLLDQCKDLEDASCRERFEAWVKIACEGDLWAPLREEAVRQGIRLKLGEEGEKGDRHGRGTYRPPLHQK